MSVECNDIIRRLVDDYYGETFGNLNNAEKSFDYPIIGCSRGTDKLYDFFKEDIGDFYWTPVEAFSLEYDEFDIEKLSVVSFVFPQTNETKLSNLKETTYTSRLWAAHRLKGQAFINSLMKYLVTELESMGIRAISPTLNENWENHKSLKYGYASNWSERHTAYVSGLGTFGLSDGLITEVGKAHRCGSIIIEHKMEYNVRKYNSHMEYCLFYIDGSCKSCISRCPANAITKNGHDKLKCREYQRDILRPYLSTKYNISSSSCGLCQVGVPCESKIPT